MTLAAEIVAKLNEPLDPKRVKKREGSGGRSLSYLEGHDVVRTANEVFGVGNWTYFVTELTLLGEEPVTRSYDDRKGFRVAYRAVVTVGSGGSGYSDVGFGDAMEYTGSKLTPHELASKEAVTDALKRALKNFGDQFGLCLYDKDAPEHNGSSAPRSGATQQPVGGQQGGGVVSDGNTPPSTTFTPPAVAAEAISGANGDWVWESGKHAGVALKDTPLSYVTWYAEKGPKADVRQRCTQFLTPNGSGMSIQDADHPDNDVPFDRTIDGLGN